MNKKNLLKMAALLESNAANSKGMKFDLHTVAGWVDDEFVPPSARKLDVSCNTVGCAIGLAAVSRAFEKDGLGFTLNTNNNCIEMNINGEDAGFISVGIRLFDIDSNTSIMFFDPSSYCGGTIIGAEGELRVAKRIRRYVESDGDYVANRSD